MRPVVRCLGLLLPLIDATASFGQTPAAPPDNWGKSAEESPRPRRRPVGFIGWARGAARDSVQAAYIAHVGLQHEFDSFYSNAAGAWYVLSTSFGEREGESRFILVSCPKMDKATFRDDFPYWHDRRAVYYARLSYFQQSVFLVTEADPMTFRTLDFQRLAVDVKHVFEGGAVVPGLFLLRLRVYTPNGERYGLPDVSPGDAYLVSDQVGYRPNGQRLTQAEVMHFRPPASYRLTYPLPTRQPVKMTLKRAAKHRHSTK